MLKDFLLILLIVFFNIQFNFCSINNLNSAVASSSWKDLLFGGNWGFGSNNEESKKTVVAREARFIPLFTVLQIGPGNCQAQTGELGNCMPTNDCRLRGGIPAGPCAGGYGLCCVFMQTCGGIIRENTTYFVNPNHPEIYDQTGSCQITIQKLHPDICQIRLDFEIFSIAPPEPFNHLCNQDQLLVSGGSSAPAICGTSPGDHMYIDAGLGQSNPIVVSVITGGISFPRIWRIRVSQIHCASIYRAEQGCLQYFTGISGRVKSFNFNTISGRQLSNQDYSICIRTERNFCTIRYTACLDRDNNRSRSFTLSGNSNGIVGSMVGSGTTGQPNACPNDWLLIGCIRIADRVPQANACEDRVCGGTFNAEISNQERQVTSNVRPFRLFFHTDAVEAPIDVDNNGFCLDYVQQPCTNG